MSNQKKLKICEKCGCVITQGHNCKSAEGLKTYAGRIWAGTQFKKNMFVQIKTENAISFLPSGAQLDGRIMIGENIIKDIDTQIKALEDYKKQIIVSQK